MQLASPNNKPIVMPQDTPEWVKAEQERENSYVASVLIHLAATSEEVVNG